MKTISNPRALLGLSLAIGLLLALTSVGFARAGSRSVSADPTPATSLASLLGVFSRSAVSSDTAPTSIQTELQDVVGSAPATASVSIGSLDLNLMRRLVDSQGTSIYAAPTDTGAVCYAVTSGPVGCDDSYNFADGPMSVGVFDADELGAGVPMAVYGVIKDNVTSVSVIDSSGNTLKAAIGENAFFVRLGDSSAWPTTVSATLRDGSAVSVTLAKPTLQP